MTINEEIEAIEGRLRWLKENNISQIEAEMADKKEAFMKRADTLDPKFKALYHSINDAVENIGWKDFYYGVFNYQKNCVDSGYIFK